MVIAQIIISLFFVDLLLTVDSSGDGEEVKGHRPGVSGRLEKGQGGRQNLTQSSITHIT